MNKFENGCDIARNGMCGNDEAQAAQSGRVGVSLWPGRKAAWPVGKYYDRELLKTRDRRSAGDHYRYWMMDAIRTGVIARSLPFEVAVENLDYGFDIGSTMQTASAVDAHRVHVVGRRRWNRRGAMVIDRYPPVDHRPEVRELVEHYSREGLTLVDVDNAERSIALEGMVLPGRACPVFGSEASGLSEEMIRVCDTIVAITQRGSVRPTNVGYAVATVMWAYALRLEGAEISRPVGEILS